MLRLGSPVGDAFKRSAYKVELLECSIGAVGHSIKLAECLIVLPECLIEPHECSIELLERSIEA